MDERRAMILLGGFQSLSGILHAVCRFSATVDRPGSKKDVLEKIFKDTHACITFRNKLAHGGYWTDEKGGQVVLQPYPSDPRKIKKGKLQDAISLRPALFEREIARILMVTGSIYHNFLKKERPD